MDAELSAQIARREGLIEEIRRILVDDLHLSLSEDAIEPDVVLFGTGLALDSVEAVELVVAAEQRFQVRLPEDVLRGSLRTINTLVDLVLRARGEA